MEADRLYVRRALNSTEGKNGTQQSPQTQTKKLRIKKDGRNGQVATNQFVICKLSHHSHFGALEVNVPMQFVS